MRVLFLGQIGLGQTSRMRMRALERLGNTVQGVHTTEPWHQAPWLTRQVQRQLQGGSIVNEINRRVREAARTFKPQLVWAEKQEFLHAETIDELRNAGARVIHFTPDPYFSLAWKRTRLMDEALGAFDVVVYCKSYEKTAYEALGKPLVYMPLGYCDEVHRPLPSNDPKWQCKVGFLGGWEPRREKLLHALAATGEDLKIWGGYWDFLRDGRWSLRRYIAMRQLAGGADFAIHMDDVLAQSLQGGEVYADDYARALTGALIGIGFLRAVCPEQHTTRTFEIPACGSMLLADRTAEHQEYFEEGIEAEFFEAQDEMLDKIAFYSRNDAARRRIAELGHERCITGNYSYLQRMTNALRAVQQA